MVRRLHTRIAAAGAGVMLVASIPVAANAAAPTAVAPVRATAAAGVVAADPVYPPVLKPVSCKISPKSGRTKVKINMGPNLPGKQYYIFRMEKKTSAGWVRYLKQYRTKGKGETRTVNVPKGTWRAKCYSRGFPLASPRIDNTSKSVKIKR